MRHFEEKHVIYRIGSLSQKELFDEPFAIFFLSKEQL